MNIKIKHIYHSGFLLETEDLLMVFDYYRGEISLKDKKTIVFVSHGHEDHYSEEIFQWNESIGDIHYVVSSDIENLPQIDNMTVMDPYQTINIGDLEINSFGSTDLGLSFVINYKGKNIFFAGDLNWWHWENDSKETQKDEEFQFKEEIDKIKRIHNHIDLVFIPVDPRLGQGFSLAGEWLIKEFTPKVLVPMHFGDKFHTSKDLINKTGDIKTEIVDIREEGQVFELEI